MVFNKKAMPLLNELQAACGEQLTALNALNAYMAGGGEDEAVIKKLLDSFEKAGALVAGIVEKLQPLRLDKRV